MPPPPQPPPFYWGDTPEEEYYKSQGVSNTKSYFQTPYDTKIFTQSWLPLDPNQPIKATVFMTHGYTNDTSWAFQKICIAYASWGYAVFAADLIGHGLSDGLHGYIGDMDKAAATSLSYFISVRKSDHYSNLPAFLFGESMGALITMLMYFQSDPDTWTGIIFSAPLFVVPEPMMPSKLHLTLYGLLFGLADTWAVMPGPKGPPPPRPGKPSIKAMNPRRYAGKARVGTMREVARVTEHVRKKFEDVKVPFFAGHGLSDPMACHSGSEMLYEKAVTAKEDKALKLYEGMGHSLINGESDEDADRVLMDMKAWIDEKAIKFGSKGSDN
ncbi:caffeoylshikimate esterase-like [Rutidosis leptorrhynchoides]|uniref:caffeoylshikimate esterase-like n=1 Tax=Rutidosis leptorrhynchoides TaxID=125765 RepID=UPI003A9A245C